MNVSTDGGVTAYPLGAEGQIRVLVADDNYPSAMSLTWAMEASGYDVRTCYDGRAAVAVARDFHPDVVLLDLDMPVMDGLEACKAMRAQPRLSNILIIAQTALEGAQARCKTREAGFNYHVVKPLNLRQVEELVSGGPLSRA